MKTGRAPFEIKEWNCFPVGCNIRVDGIYEGMFWGIQLHLKV